MHLVEAPAEIFLAGTAVKGGAVGQVADALVAVARQHGLAADSAPAGEDKGPNDIELFARPSGWVVLRWFEYCTCHLPVSKKLSRRLGTVVCTADIHGNAWRHLVFERGRVADRFASNRQHVGARSRRRWAGDPAVLASLAGGEGDALAPYLVEVSGDELPAKAHPDDRFDLGEPSVFIDLWRRMGIRYPGDDDRADAIVRYGADWEARLPYEVADF
jgi:hypothetical protein